MLIRSSSDESRIKWYGKFIIFDVLSQEIFNHESIVLGTVENMLGTSIKNENFAYKKLFFKVIYSD